MGDEQSKQAFIGLVAVLFRQKTFTQLQVEVGLTRAQIGNILLGVLAQLELEDSAPGKGKRIT